MSQSYTDDELRCVDMLLGLKNSISHNNNNNSSQPVVVLDSGFPKQLCIKLNNIVNNNSGSLPHNWICYEWLIDNWRHPYPSVRQKQYMLSNCSEYDRMSQINNFFINIRRRCMDFKTTKRQRM
jgi:hypothetical protein